jgi:hypothetical protein
MRAVRIMDLHITVPPAKISKDMFCGSAVLQFTGMRCTERPRQRGKPSPIIRRRQRHQSPVTSHQSPVTLFITFNF